MEIVTVERIQAFLRETARHSYDTYSVPPFTLFFHPGDPLTHFNYAVPDEPVTGNLSLPLSALRHEFARRGRRARFEFIEDFAPNLAPILEGEGFFREGRYHLMAATPATFRPASPPSEVTVAVLDHSASDMDLLACVSVQARGFGLEAAVTGEDTDRQRSLLAAGSRAFLACLNGEPAGAGICTAPFDGLTELAGIATLPEARREGVATALTSAALQYVFARGVEVAILTAADERAGRVYERVGFHPYTAMLHYLDSDLETEDRFPSAS